MRNKIKEDMKLVLKGEYDFMKLNLLQPEPLKAIRFGELMGEID